MAEAKIYWLSGPLLKARYADAERSAFQLYEAVQVGALALPGEVIRLDGDSITVQLYEDATGLAPGMRVHGTGMPLSIPLGPALLGGIFDGLLRPLDTSGDFIQRGLGHLRQATFAFRPLVKVGQELQAGQLFAEVSRSASAKQFLILSPVHSGVVSWLAEAGTYDETAPVLTLTTANGETLSLTMQQWWPVRQARPMAARLPIAEPLLTGQRVIDSLFPLGLGSRAAVPGGFGTGKTILLETIAKWCNAEVIVYVGCGERGNELTGMLEEFPTLEDPRSGEPLLKRTVIIANTSNMSVAAREASIYTGVTVAEYFRDQGKHVALIADSTSRWAEALRELSGRLGEIPGEGGYPPYLSSRLADFYERAGLVRTLGGARGSVTIIGAVSPPSGDFSEPVVTHTKRYVRAFWALDSKRAYARIYPALDPLQSYSLDTERLQDYWAQQGQSQWLSARRELLTLLEEHVRLQRMARIIGKDGLAPLQQLILLFADMVTDAFLRQSAFSENDRFASAERQALTLSLLLRFYRLAKQALAEGFPWAQLETQPLLRTLQRMSEDFGEDLDAYKALQAQLTPELFLQPEKQETQP